MLFWNTTLSGLQLGLCYAVVALGMYIAYSILDFPDLTTDGSFPLGGVVATALLYRLGFPAWLTLPASFLAGAVCGTLTGVLHVRFRISPLLSGIIVMTALLSGTLVLTTCLTGTGYSVTIFSFKANGICGLFDPAGARLPVYAILLLLCGIVLLFKYLLDLFLRTRCGFLLRAAGDNAQLVTSLGRDVGRYKILGLALANGLSALGGCLYAHLNTQYDNTSGSGKVVLALASVIIGTALFSRVRFLRPTTAVVLGALLYALCLNYLTLIDPNGLYLKLMNAAAFAAILILYDRLGKKKAPEGRRTV